MKKILLTALLFSLIVSVASLGWAGGLDDFKAGEAAFQGGNYDEAIRLLTKATASGELDREQLKTAYKFRSNAWINKGNYDRAIVDYTKAIEIDPKFAVAYYDRGIAWYYKGDFDKAIADYTKAIEINPTFAYVYGNRGIAWGKKGDYDKAITDFTKAIEINPRFAQAYHDRGIAWSGKGDYDKAIVDYTRAIELDPKDANVYNNRSNAWRMKGDYDKVIADLTKAIEIDPKHANAYTGLAWLMATCPESRYRNGKRAVELAEKAVKLLEMPHTLATLAAAYAEAGRFQEAIKTQERAITKLKQEGRAQYRSECEKYLSSYKAGKPWREK